MLHRDVLYNSLEKNWTGLKLNWTEKEELVFVKRFQSKLHFFLKALTSTSDELHEVKVDRTLTCWLQISGRWIHQESEWQCNPKKMSHGSNLQSLDPTGTEVSVGMRQGTWRLDKKRQEETKIIHSSLRISSWSGSNGGILLKPLVHYRRQFTFWHVDGDQTIQKKWKEHVTVHGTGPRSCEETILLTAPPWHPETDVKTLTTLMALLPL